MPKQQNYYYDRRRDYRQRPEETLLPDQIAFKSVLGDGLNTSRAQVTGQAATIRVPAGTGKRGGLQAGELNCIQLDLLPDLFNPPPERGYLRLIISAGK